MLQVDERHSLTVRDHIVLWWLADSDRHFFKVVIMTPKAETLDGEIAPQCPLELKEGQFMADDVADDIGRAVLAETNRVASEPGPPPPTKGTLYESFTIWRKAAFVGTMEPVQAGRLMDHHDVVETAIEVKKTMVLFESSPNDEDLLKSCVEKTGVFMRTLKKYGIVAPGLLSP